MTTVLCNGPCWRGFQHALYELWLLVELQFGSLGGNGRQRWSMSTITPGASKNMRTAVWHVQFGILCKLLFYHGRRTCDLMRHRKRGKLRCINRQLRVERNHTRWDGAKLSHVSGSRFHLLSGHLELSKLLVDHYKERVQRSTQLFLCVWAHHE